MPLYVGDFLADTMHLSAIETGIYVRLLMHCWQHKTIPTDNKKLSLIAHCDPRLWHQYRETVLAFFDTVDAFTMQHKRVSAELHRSEEISNKNRDAALRMHSKRTANAHANAVLLQSHTQSQRKKERKQDAPSGATTTNDCRLAELEMLAETANEKIYAFESGVIRLSQKDFDKWKQAFGNLALEAELLALTEWAASQPKWFYAVSAALAKKNRELGLRREQGKNGPEFKWRSGIEGVV